MELLLETKQKSANENAVKERNKKADVVFCKSILLHTVYHASQVDICCFSFRQNNIFPNEQGTNDDKS